MPTEYCVSVCRMRHHHHTIFDCCQADPLQRQLNIVSVSAESNTITIQYSIACQADPLQRPLNIVSVSAESDTITIQYSIACQADPLQRQLNIVSVSA
jgi:hypothetical protein